MSKNIFLMSVLVLNFNYIFASEKTASGLRMLKPDIKPYDPDDPFFCAEFEVVIPVVVVVKNQVAAINKLEKNLWPLAMSNDGQGISGSPLLPEEDRSPLSPEDVEKINKIPDFKRKKKNNNGDNK